MISWARGSPSGREIRRPRRDRGRRDGDGPLWPDARGGRVLADGRGEAPPRRPRQGPRLHRHVHGRGAAGGAHPAPQRRHHGRRGGSGRRAHPGDGVPARRDALAAPARFASRDGEKVPLDIASAIVCDALHGLHAAHEATAETGAPLHLVHRDVSPQNLLVVADGITRVVDFGVAKAMGQVHTTREGQIKGKIAYMAPEQLPGAAGRPPRADVYAAGIVLWELLTQAPALRQRQRGGHAAQRRSCTRRSRRSSIAAHVPSALDDVVMTALARDPAARFATARATWRRRSRRASPWPARGASPSGSTRWPATGWRRAGAAFAEIERAPALAEPVTISEPPAPRPPRRWPLVLGALGLVAAAQLAVRLATSSSTEGSASAPSAQSAAPAPSASPAPSAASGVTSVTPVGEPPVPTAPAPSTPAAPTPTTKSPAAAGAARPAPGSGRSDGKAATRRGACPVRSFVDSDGIVQFRRDCEK